MKQNFENQPLLNNNNNKMAPTTPTSTNSTQPNEKPKPQWHSYRNAEIKHELILYAELAAAAAFIVGLYVLCLLPWEYIHRAQMLSTRLQPSEVSLEHAKNLSDSCDINDNVSFTIDYKLTKRPCGTSPMPARLLDIKTGGQCIPGQVNEKNRFKLGKASFRHFLTPPRYSYHDFNNFFHIECCDSEASSEKCPCGFDKIFKDKCYAFVKVGNTLCKSENIFNSTQLTQIEKLMPFLSSHDLKYYCNDGNKMDFNGTKISSCLSNLNTTFSGDKNDTQFYLCQSNFINKEMEWWRRN